MDDIEPNLFLHLTSDADVFALAGARVHADEIPEQTRGSANAYPCATFTLVGSTRDAEHCGTSDVVQASYQVDSWAKRRPDARALARAIRRRMVDYSGPMGDVEVQRVLITAEFDATDPDPGLRRRTQTYTVWYVEK